MAREPGRGQHHHGQRGEARVARDPVREARPVEPGHLVVGEDQVEGPIRGMRLLELTPGGEAVPGEHGLGPGPRQHAVEDAAARLVVVGDEDAQSPEQAQVDERLGSERASCGPRSWR